MGGAMIRFFKRSIAISPGYDSPIRNVGKRLYRSFETDDVQEASLALTQPSPFSSCGSPIVKRNSLSWRFDSPERVLESSYDFLVSTPRSGGALGALSGAHNRSMSTIVNSILTDDGIQQYFLGGQSSVRLPDLPSGRAKLVVPAVFEDDGHRAAAVAVVTVDFPREISESGRQFGVLGRFQLEDGRYVQLLRRGVTHRELRDWLKTRPEPPLAKIAYLLRQTVLAARVLHTLHQENVAHMDIKASNMVVYPDGGGLIDIDKAPAIGDRGGFDYDSFYASPSRPHCASTASDVYSLGSSVRFIVRTLDNNAVDMPELRPLFNWVSRTQSRSHSDRPSLPDSIEHLSQLPDRLAQAEDIAQLHTAFVADHDHIFNSAHPEFFKPIDQNSSWDD